MTSFNELAIIFKNIIDELFNFNGFECRKIFYGDAVFYCGRDILKCLNYNEKCNNIDKVFNKLKQENKFTIKELQEKYLSFPLETNINNNLEFLNKLDKNEINNIYINKLGLYELIMFSRKEKTQLFKKFIFKILLPALDIKYKKILNNQYDDSEIQLYINQVLDNNNKILNKILNKIKTIENKNNELSSNNQKLLDDTELLKQDNTILKEDNEVINDELNNIKDYLLDITEKQEKLKNILENKLNNSFVMYKIDKFTYYCLRGENKYVNKKLQDIEKEKIIINLANCNNPIDFYQKFKEESKERLNILKKRIIKALHKKIPDFNPNSIDGKKLIIQNINKLKEFTINDNILYLNRSTIDDIIKFYNTIQSDYM